MNKIKDYNIELLNALNSWFWYNGLLEQDGDEWEIFKGVAKPKYTEDCTILTLIKALRENENDFLTLDYLRTKYNLDFYYNEELNVLWLLLVDMFGECGTSPRSGWLVKRKECAEFLETIVCIE